jgi:hypothetical protein
MTWFHYIGRAPLNFNQIREIGGSYNFFLQTSLPDELKIYDPKKQTEESSHKTFTTTFPRGFAIEILHVYSGPPNIVYKFRHWAYMEGPFQGHAPTGKKVEFYGMAHFEVTVEWMMFDCFIITFVVIFVYISSQYQVANLYILICE